MKVTKKETNDQRKRQKVSYSLQDLTAAEFETICKALGLVEGDAKAAKLANVLSELASAPGLAEEVAAENDTDQAKERLIAALCGNSGGLVK